MVSRRVTVGPAVETFLRRNYLLTTVLFAIVGWKNALAYSHDLCIFAETNLPLCCLTLWQVSGHEEILEIKATGDILQVKLEHNHGRFILRSADNHETCLTAVTPSGGAIIQSTDLASVPVFALKECHDSSSCSPTSQCTATAFAQSFSLSRTLANAAPTTQAGVDARVRDSRFKKIYSSIILCVFSLIVVLLCYRYDIIPDRIKDVVYCRSFRSRRNNELLKGLDLDSKGQKTTLVTPGQKNPISTTTANKELLSL